MFLPGSGEERDTAGCRVVGQHRRVGVITLAGDLKATPGSDDVTGISAVTASFVSAFAQH
jgi:hypothetical protein